jgi:hypothetical protein
MEFKNVRNDFCTWFHSKSPITYKQWYGTNLVKKLDEIENTYYESFNEKVFDIDPEDIQAIINTIKNNMKNRYNVPNTSFAEYDTRNQNGKPKSILNNYYTKYLSGLNGGGENIDDEKNKAEEDFNGTSYKNDLKNILVNNLDVIETELKIVETDSINGLKYSVGGKNIDILAIDKDNNYVVIELNYGKSYENIIGKVLKNKNLIQRKEAKAEQKVRGIIISNEITEDLKMACLNLPDIELCEYKLSVKIERIN